MSHPTDNVNGGIEAPTVPTPRPEGYNEREGADPTRYDERGEEEVRVIQDVIRQNAEKG